jgi:hypothetical protein
MRLSHGHHQPRTRRQITHLLKAGLGPFVERELKAKYGDGWAFEAKDVLSDTRLSAGNSDPTGDVAAMLVIMDRKWGDVFRHILGKSERSLVNEIIGVRNRWAHQEPFSGDDAYRALDSVERLLSAVSAPEGEEVDRMKMELLRVRFDEQARGEKRKSAGIAIESGASGSPQALARGGDAARGRGERALSAGGVRRRPLAGASRRRHARVPRPGGVLPPDLSHREPARDADRRAAPLDRRRRRPGDPVADQLRRRQDARHAGALSPDLGHPSGRVWPASMP